MKIRCITLAKELETTPEWVLEQGAKLVPAHLSVGKGKNTWYVEEGADLIRQAKVAPLTVAERHKAYGIHAALNPRWVYCKLESQPGKKVPVAVPRKLRGKLVGKHFMVEAIRDVNGVTYRHEAFSR